MMKTKLFAYSNHFALLLSIFVGLQPSSAQSRWMELKEQGANYETIKTAFLQENARKMREFRREMRREAARTTDGRRAGDEAEQAMESILLFQRWSDFVEPRVVESNGDLSIITEGMSRAVANRAREADTRAAANWRLLGPKNTAIGGGNGRVNAIRVHPTNANIMFVCTPAGGVWRSVNAGTSWTPVTDNLAVLGATDVAFDPTNPNIMYLATGDGEASDTRSIGVFKSLDGGTTWTPTALAFDASQGRQLSRVSVMPNNPNVVFASGNGGIWRSTDAGASWAQVSTASVKDFEFKPTDPNTMYACGSAFFRSTNGGTTWVQTTAGFQPTGISRMAAAVTPASPNTVYLVAANTSNYGFQGFYVSTDAGATFTLRTASPNILGWETTGTDVGGQGWYDLAIAASPTDPNTLYVGGINVWKTTNGGTNWNINTHWYGGGGKPYVHADIHDLVCVGQNVFAASDGGISVSSTGGASWANISNNLAIAQIYAIGLSASSPNLIISGHQDNGTEMTSDANSWREIYGGDGMQCFIDKTNNATIYASLYYGDLYKSTNGGTTFTGIGAGFPQAAWVTPWLQDPVSSNTLYAGAKQVYKSINGGTNFTAISNFANTNDLIAIDVSNLNNQHIIAATRTKIFRTTNAGATWTDITTGVSTTGTIMNVKLDNNSLNTIYAVLGSYTGNSVYRSTDGGITWASFSTGLPPIPAKCIVSQTHTSGTLYVGTDIGIYYRDNGLNQWLPYNNAMPAVPITDLEIYAPTQKLRAATYGRGIWESDLATVGANTTNQPPVVSLTNLSANAYTSPAIVSLTASASDNDGIVTRVEFYNGNALLAAVTTTPYAYSWVNVPAGTYTITVKAYDNASATATATTTVAVSIPNAPPSITITSPTAGSAISLGNAVTIAANATDPNGNVQKVDFFNGNTPLGTVTTPPYTLTLSNLAVGNYNFVARATDNLGAMTTSTSVNFAVTQTIVNLDAAITAILAPVGIVTNPTANPNVTIKNNGLNTITNALIRYKINNGTEKTFNWNGSITKGNSSNIALPSIVLPLGANAFTATVANPNGAADEVAANNTMTANFTYLTAGATCANNFEQNNLATQAPTLSINTTTYSMIQTSGDVDFFKINTTNISPKLKISLNNLPADYEIELYAITPSGGLGRRLALSYIGGNANEVIRYNTPTNAATYFIKITGYNAAFDATKCYALEIAASNTNFTGQEDSNAGRSAWKDAPLEITESGMVVSAFPNPVREGFTTVKVVADDADDYNIILFDMQGKEIIRLTETLEKGENLLKMPVQNVIKGTYVIRVENKNRNTQTADNKKFAKLKIE